MFWKYRGFFHQGKKIKAKVSPLLFCSSSNMYSVYQLLKMRHFQQSAQIKRPDAVVRIIHVQSSFLKHLHDTLLRAAIRCWCSIIFISLVVSDMTETGSYTDVVASDVAPCFSLCFISVVKWVNTTLYSGSKYLSNLICVQSCMNSYVQIMINLLIESDVCTGFTYLVPKHELGLFHNFGFSSLDYKFNSIW